MWEAKHDGDESSEQEFSGESPKSEESELRELVQADKGCLLLSRSLGSCEGGSDAARRKCDKWKKNAHKELKKKDYKALFMIHQYVDADNFEKVSDIESVKEAWEILEKSFRGA